MAGCSDLRAETYFPILPIRQPLARRTVDFFGVRSRLQRRDRPGFSPDSPVLHNAAQIEFRLR